MAGTEQNLPQNDGSDSAEVANAHLGDGLYSTTLPGDHLEARRRAFATTHWSLVLAAGSTQSLQAKEALETLCRAY